MKWREWLLKILVLAAPSWVLILRKGKSGLNRAGDWVG
jgi:hypothetical protein